MKKILKPKSSSAPRQDEQDMAALINKMQEQLVSLEKKIDILINRPSEKPPGDGERHFSKPFQRFDREKNFTQVICSDCHKECEVPFKPSGDRPVYCKECFAKRKDRDPHKENYDNKPREQVFAPKHHFDKRKRSGFQRRSH